MISGDLVGSYANKSFPTPEGAVDALVRELDYLEYKVLPAAMKIAMNRYLNVVANRVANRNSSGYPGGTSSNSLSSRSGHAVKTIRNSVKVREEGDEILGVIGGAFYLRTHEFGATIRAKRSQYLTIPLPAALDARGVPIKRRARDWADTFIIRSKKNNLLIVQRQGTKIVPLYVLKKEVHIPKRLGMLTEILNTQGILMTYLKEAVEKEFKL